MTKCEKQQGVSATFLWAPRGQGSIGGSEAPDAHRDSRGRGAGLWHLQCLRTVLCRPSVGAKRSLRNPETDGAPDLTSRSPSVNEGWELTTPIPFSFLSLQKGPKQEKEAMSERLERTHLSRKKCLFTARLGTRVTGYCHSATSGHSRVPKTTVL